MLPNMPVSAHLVWSQPTTSEFPSHPDCIHVLLEQNLNQARRAVLVSIDDRTSTYMGEVLVAVSVPAYVNGAILAGHVGILQILVVSVPFGPGYNLVKCQALRSCPVFSDSALIHVQVNQNSKMRWRSCRDHPLHVAPTTLRHHTMMKRAQLLHVGRTKLDHLGHMSMLRFQA